MSVNIKDFMNLQDYLDKKNVEGFNLRYLRELVDVATSMFSYEGLDGELTSQIIEMALMFNHNLCFYQTDGLGPEPILCRYVPNGQFDKYRKPTQVDLYTFNGQCIATGVDFSEIILVRDNRMDIPQYLVLDDLMMRMKHIEDTLDVNIQLLRLPLIFRCDKKQMNSYKQLFKSIENCQPFVIANTNFAQDVEGINIPMPVSPEEIFSLFDKYKDLARESFGIASTIQKASRVQAAEVQAQNDYVNFVYQERKSERELWIKLYNKKYNKNITLVENYELFSISDAHLEAVKQISIDTADKPIVKDGDKDE